jgi:hypothetical protein
MTRQHARESWGKGDADEQYRPCSCGGPTEGEERLNVIRIITDGDHVPTGAHQRLDDIKVGTSLTGDDHDSDVVRKVQSGRSSHHLRPWAEHRRELCQPVRATRHDHDPVVRRRTVRTG